MGTVVFAIARTSSVASGIETGSGVGIGEGAGKATAEPDSTAAAMAENQEVFMMRVSSKLHEREQV